MSATSKIDPSTLGWVKTEIDETLRQARLALESFVENPADTTRLRFCVTYLHQVVGTLKMVELDGPALLAQEIERLVGAVLEEHVQADSAIFELLSRTILTLPDYLGRLQFGQADVPLRLLPLLNELRQARGAESFSEVELFHPDLSVRPITADKRRISDAEFIDYTKKTRPAFQAALLNWLRDPANKEHLDGLVQMVQAWEAVCSAANEQLFWVAAALLAAFGAGDLQVTNDRKKLVSRLDQLIKKIIDGAPKGELRSTSDALVKAMLFELAHVQSQEERVLQVKRAFDLEVLIGAGPDAEQAPSPEALQSVGAALGKEIESAQDLLSTYFSASEPDPRSLELLREQLEKMSGTLEMLGILPLRQLVDELAETVGAVARGEIVREDAVAMHMASSLLLLENSSQEIHQSGAGWKKHIDEGVAALRRLRGGEGSDEAGIEGIEISDASLTDIEFKQLLSVVAGEIRVNLSKVEEALEAFAVRPEEPGQIQQVPQHLSQVQGALQILGQDRAAELTAIASARIQDIYRQTLTPSRAIFEALAVAVGTIGAYLEGLEHNRPHLDSLLDVALHDLDIAIDPSKTKGETSIEIDPQPRQMPNDVDDRKTTTMLDEVLAESDADHESDGVEMRDAWAPSIEGLHVSQQPSQEAIPMAAKEPSRENREPASAVRPTIVVATPAPPSPLIVKPAGATGMADLDEEIMQIFIEDAREMLQIIDQTLGQWQSNPDNREALSELRRAFHTLKGSGRMVGASDIAELAWAVESLLNRIRENKARHSDAMFALMHEVRAALPGLIGELEGAPNSGVDVALLRSRVNEVAGDAASASSARGGATPAIDATLLQIFSTETRGHLTTIREFLAVGTGQPVSHNLLRAAHTLQGSSRSLGLLSMAEACGEMERYLQAAEVRQLPLDEASHRFLLQLDEHVSALVRELNQGHVLTSALHAAFATLGRALSAETTRLSVYPPVARVEERSSAVSPAVPDISHKTIDAPSPPAASPAAPAAAVPTDGEGVGVEAITENIDPELLEIFHEEAVDILESIEAALTRWRANRSDKTAAPDIKRYLHTLKGGARMAGAMTVGNIGHHTESLLKQVEEGKTALTPELLDLLDEVHDSLVVMIERLQSRRPLPSTAAALDAKLTQWLSGSVPVKATRSAPMPTTAQSAVVAEAPPVPSSLIEPVQAKPDERMQPETEEGEDEEIGDRFGDRPERRDQIKVRTALLNDLVNYAGEVSISRARMEQQIFGFREHLVELNNNVTRFRQQLRELEIQSESQILYRAEQVTAGIDSDFDPLEFDRYSKLQHLSRALAESLHDLSTIQSTLDNFAAEAETVLQQQARVNTELQEGLMRTRMISFSTQAARLRHLVRQTVRELGKRAELEIVGADVEVDRNVLERMIGPFEHMIRNSLDHGIEAEPERRRAGKSPVGKIVIETSHEGSEIVLRFSDDGAGLDVAAIRKKAKERGLMQADSNLSDDEVMQFILLPGFSTAKKITHLSGRGVGMDVVHNEVKQLGGSITVDTRRGAGTTFIIRLPLTLSITQALTVYVGEQRFAVPLASIVNILEVPVEKLNQISMGEKPLFGYDDQLYPFMHLGARLAIPPVSQSEKKVPVLLVKAGTREIALQVDGLGSTQEAVIKSVGPQIAELKGIAGATILGDGSVVLILDIAGLWITDEALRIEHVHREEEKPEEEARGVPLIMVVDDSLTVRKVTSRHLQKRGMEVAVAKDGLDALEQLREQVPDVMLVDIEMPRMDGYELTTNVRSDPRLRHIPIIMITSRAGAKHRERAMQLGVNMYMSKPYQEDELMANIESLLQRRGAH